ncbi:hypothetical protein DM860_001453 [Cuscuta australis]|uniref:Uncharacterized protein n=1 Tax=Cuscuta australis TaxID=267555 RepID=A0A328E8E7_9ASTE|nr:hypothetical protein DM860_001453 [Cuscuta australis]
MRRSRGGLENCDGSRPMRTTALNSASQRMNESRSLRNQEMERRGEGSHAGESVGSPDFEAGRSSEKRSATCFWKNSRSSSSWSWGLLPLSMEATWLRRMLMRFKNEP